MEKEKKTSEATTRQEDQLKKSILEVLNEVMVFSHPKNDLITIDEAVQLTKLAKQTIYGKVSGGTIPFIKRPNSKKLLFSRKSLILWLTEKGGEIKE